MFTIVLSGSINHKLFEHFVISCEEAIAEGEHTEICIILSSRGGDGDVALAFFDYIRRLPVDVTCHAYGDVMSSAFLILQACHKRLLAPYARLMWHDAWDSVDGKYEGKELREKAKELEEVDRLCNLAVAERLGVDIETVEEWAHAETYWTAPLALKDGLIDGYTRDMPARPERSR